MENYCTHNEASVKAWLERKRGRFQAHFTPTGSSWMNLVERFFRDITEDVIREGSFESVRELSEAIITCLADRNEQPKISLESQGAGDSGEDPARPRGTGEGSGGRVKTVISMYLATAA